MGQRGVVTHPPSEAGKRRFDSSLSHHTPKPGVVLRLGISLPRRPDRERTHS